MAEVTLAKVTELVKRDNGISQKGVADKLGVSTGQVSMTIFSAARVAAGVYNKQPATAASVKKLRDSEGNRWELIAARTGLSVTKARELYGGEAKARASYSGRGRDFSNGNSSSTRSTQRSGSGRGSAGKKGSTKKATAAASRKGGATAKKGGIVRNKAGRRSTAGNPS